MQLVNHTWTDDVKKAVEGVTDHKEDPITFLREIDLQAISLK